MSSVTFKASDGQVKKIKHAMKTGADATLTFKASDIHLADDKPNLIPQLAANACRCKKSGKGMKLSLSQIPKQGGILPLLIPALGPLLAGALTGGAALTKTIMDNKRAYRELDETRRHNEAMEPKAGSGIKMCTKCKGSGIYQTSRRGDGIYQTSRRGDGIYQTSRRGDGVGGKIKKRTSKR